MPSYSLSSQDKLKTCHPLLQTWLQELILRVDHTILYGHRTIPEQQKLYAQGRTEPGSIVTNCDGVKNKSKHNWSPSLAVDIAPYSKKLKGPDWTDISSFHYLAGVGMELARSLSVPLVWGGHWAMRDLPHFELNIQEPA